MVADVLLIPLIAAAGCAVPIGGFARGLIGGERTIDLAAYVPDEIRAFAARTGRILGFALLAFVFAAPILFFHNRYLLDLGIQILTYVMLGWGLNIVVGLAGLLDLGYVAFYAVGAYSYALLAQNFGWSFWLCLPVAGCLAAFWGVLLGFPVLRLRGDYLAIVTLAFGEIIRVLILNIDKIGAARGFSGVPHWSNFFWVYFFAGLTILISIRLVKSSVGRAFLAVREDQIAAEAMGVDTTRYKVKAFIIGSFLAGVAGGLFAHYMMYLNPQMFTFIRSFELIAMVVLGGLGSITGSIIAAIILTILPEGLRAAKEVLHSTKDPRMLIYSIMLITLMLTRPQGLFGRRELWDVLARRKDVVPKDTRDEESTDR